MDSPLATKWVPAPDNWSRGGVPIKAIVIHMAEGGGTVSWLTRDDGNSSHYVVEYSGRIVQMVDEDRAAGSINPKLLRTSNDTAFTYLGQVIRYGITALRSAIGDLSPNAAVIAIEVEGFAADGPNGAQRVSLNKLVADIRRRRGAGLHVLGHRDFQSYKACPGKRIPWVDYGQHGAPVPEEEEMPAVQLTLVRPLNGSAVVDGPGHSWIRLWDSYFGAIGDGFGPKQVCGSAVLDAPVTSPGGTVIPAGTPVYLIGDDAAIFLQQDVAFTPAPTPPADCTEEIAAAIAADRQRARIVYS